ncbi:hypothetical protein PG989_004186 [Apiospora arundinis]
MSDAFNSDDGRSGANEIDKLIRANDIVGVRDYLQAHHDIQKWWLVRPDGYDDCNAITLAASVGSLEVLQILMAAAGDVDWAFPLHQACSSHQVDVVRWLLDTSKDAASEVLKKDRGHHPDTPLLAALHDGNPMTYKIYQRVAIPQSVWRPQQEDVVHLLLDRGADIQDKRFIFPHKIQPLEDSWEEEDAGDPGADPIDDLWGNPFEDPWGNPLDSPWAVDAQNHTFTSTEYFQDYHDSFPLPNTPKKPIEKPVLKATVLTLALSFGSAHLICRLIDGGCDIHAKIRQWGDGYLLGENTDDITPLHIACGSKNIAGVRLLLQSGGSDGKAMVAARDSWGMTPFHWTTFDALELYPKGYPWSEMEMTPSEKTKTCLELLLACDSTHLDAQDYWGNTALHYAAFLELTDVAEFLLARGADPNMKNKDGRTPIFNKFTPENLDLFVRYGARLQETDTRGDTLLHLASRSWQARDLVRWLLAHGVRSDSPNAKQQLPLHLAAICVGEWNNGLGAGGFHAALKAQNDMMRMLQEAGAEDGGDMMEVPDVAGVTPRQSLAASRAKAKQIAAHRASDGARQDCIQVEERQFRLGYKRLPVALKKIVREGLDQEFGILNTSQAQRYVSIGTGDAALLRGTGRLIQRYGDQGPFRHPRPRGLSLEQGGSVYI